jgi:hypothetical protein
MNLTYWEGITIEEAINKTQEEAKDLERLLLSLCKKREPERKFINAV